MSMMGATGAGGNILQQLSGVNDLYSLLRLIEDPKRYKSAVEEMQKLATEITVKKRIKDIESAEVALKAKLFQVSEVIDKAQAEAQEIVSTARAQANQLIHDAEQTASNMRSAAAQTQQAASEKLKQAQKLEHAAKSAQIAAEGARKAAVGAQKSAESIRLDLHERLKAVQAAAGRI